ncbi:hypothetical protein Tco_0928385, partial [Tanacetum coccineum]
HPQRGGNMDRLCDYHQEKGHHTNDCHQLKRQLEVALESGKLNHLIKDVRQRGRGNQGEWFPANQGNQHGENHIIEGEEKEGVTPPKLDRNKNMSESVTS